MDKEALRKVVEKLLRCREGKFYLKHGVVIKFNRWLSSSNRESDVYEMMLIRQPEGLISYLDNVKFVLFDKEPSPRTESLLDGRVILFMKDNEFFLRFGETSLSHSFFQLSDIERVKGETEQGEEIVFPESPLTDEAREKKRFLSHLWLGPKVFFNK
jgi:hypothetical protein